MKSLLICLNFCNGFSNPHNWYFCDEINAVRESLKQVIQDFSRLIHVSDMHLGEDYEFKYLPPHMQSNKIDVDTSFDFKNYHKYFSQLYKKHLDALRCEHNKALIIDKNYDIIALSGFNVSTDVIPTALSLIDFRQNIFVLEDCCGDISIPIKQKGLDYLRMLGVKVLNNHDYEKSKSSLFLERQAPPTTRLS